MKYIKGKTGKTLFVVLAVVTLFALYLTAGNAPTEVLANGQVSLAGRLMDRQGESIRHAQVLAFVNNRAEPDARAESQGDGGFVLDLPSERIEALTVKIERHHFSPYTWEATADDLSRLNKGESVRLADVQMERQVRLDFWVATAIFVAMLFLIALEKLHNTTAALLGAAAMQFISLVGGFFTSDLFIFDFKMSLEHIDFEVIFLVMGMMIIIGVIEETGVFQWTAYQAYRLSGGRAWLLAVILMVVTVFASALLDNVTTMLLVAPLTIQIALAMGLNPLSLLIPEVLASNVGGLSTLIGTPVNIIIGSYANLTFEDFLFNLTPGVVMALIVLTIYVLIYYRKELWKKSGGISQALLDRLRESGRITQPEKLRKAGTVFVAVILLFIVGERLHLTPAVTAIVGAAAMLLWVAPDVDETLRAVDWTTLIFFIALFIVIGGIQEVGLISFIAEGISWLVGDNLAFAVLVTVWSAAFLSGVIDNVPFAVAMLPVVRFLTRTIPGATNNVLFYGLCIGADMGGNSTLIGASANLVTAGIAERAGYRISYMEFLKVGLPATIITVLAGLLWLFIHFGF